MEPYHEKHKKIIEHYKKECNSLGTAIDNLESEGKDLEFGSLLLMLNSSLTVYDLIVKSLENIEMDYKEKMILTYVLETFEFKAYYSEKIEYLKENYPFLDDDTLEIICGFFPNKIDYVTLNYLRSLEVNKKDTFIKRIKLYRINKKLN